MTLLRRKSYRRVALQIIRETTEAQVRAPDPDDQHQWNLLASVPEAILATGVATLIREAPRQASVVLPRTFVESL